MSVPRSFTIFLVVVLILESGVSGFTIDRTNIVTQPLSDLDAEESSLLEFRNDIKRFDVINTNSIGKNEKVNEKKSAMENSKYTFSTTDIAVTAKLTHVDSTVKSFKMTTASFNEVSNNSTRPVIKSEDIHKNALESVKHDESSKETTQNAPTYSRLKNTTDNIMDAKEDTDVKSSSQNTKLWPVSSSTLKSDFNNNNSDTTSKTSSTHSRVSTKIQTITEQPIPTTNSVKTENKDEPTPLLENDNNNSSNSHFKPHQDLKGSIPEIIKYNISATVASIQINTTTVSNVRTTLDDDTTIAPDLDKTTETVSSDSTVTDFNNVSSSSSVVGKYRTLSINEMTQEITSAKTTTEIGSISETVNTQENSETMTADDSSSVTVPPLWKKYHELDRKRDKTTTEDNITSSTEKAIDMVETETSQIRVSIEEAFSVTPIASLESLDFLTRAATNQQSTATTPSENTLTNQSDSSSASTISMMSESTLVTKKSDTVSSKRGGYIDNSSKTEATMNLEKVNAGNKDIFRAIYDIETPDEVRDAKNISREQSQSRLAEDAMKEELLKETILNDFEENSNRFWENITEIQGNEPLHKDARSRNDAPNSKERHDNATDDALSVKPISLGKNPGLYTVNPNYKPMKKLEILPPKPFVRDPDDNSWRNESISSLGIVFKPKNSSKSFTQVLKNKTETELNNMMDKNRNDLPELRQRLEKIAEVRKKKKKTDQSGEAMYSDYEENNTSDDSSTTPNVQTTSAAPETKISYIVNIPEVKPLDLLSTEPETSTLLTTTTTITTEAEVTKYKPALLTTPKPKKFYNIAEYYDTTDEYDADYAKSTKIDLKKFTVPFKERSTKVTPTTETSTITTLRTFLPDRQPTVQYFPPRVAQKVNVNDYDDDFQRKINLYTSKDTPKTVFPISYATVPTVSMQTEKPLQPTEFTRLYKPGNINKNEYLSHPPRVTEPPNAFAVMNDGSFNRGSYIIRHYKDFINQAAKDTDDERRVEYIPTFTEPPMKGVTVNELPKEVPTKDKVKSPVDDDYDYDLQFRKDILNRFVENFNQNSERFKVDFPILYNNSVVHRQFENDGRGLALSSAFMKRLYNEVATSKPANYVVRDKPCEPNCDNMTVELSPAYELHYYVPEQEEKEEVDSPPATLPYRLTL